MAAILLLSTALPVRAEEAIRGIGFAAGWIPGTTLGGLSGVGLSYRQITPSGWGWRLGGGFGTASGTQGQPGPGLLYDVGLTGTRTIADLDWGRLYGLAGTAVYQLDHARPANWTYGAGLGFEVGSKDGVSLALDIPLAFVPSAGLALPAPALSLYYNWSEPSQGAAAASGIGFTQFARQGLGFSAGGGGLGAAYRAWHESGWGGSLTGIAFGGQGSLFASVGGSLHRLVAEAGNSRFYATGATCAFTMSSYRVNLLGLGFGIEFGPPKGANFHVEMLQTLFLQDRTFAPIPSMGLTFYY